LTLTRTAHIFAGLAWAALLFIFPVNSAGQYKDYGISVVEALSSLRMQGRGYVHNGNGRAAQYIRQEFRNAGLMPCASDYFQPFSVDVNTFPGAMKLIINGKTLRPGYDFMTDPASCGGQGSFSAVMLTLQGILSGKADSIAAQATNKALVLDFRNLAKLSAKEKEVAGKYRHKLQTANPVHACIMVELTDEKLSFGASSQVLAVPYVRVHAAACGDTVTTVDFNIRNRFVKDCKTGNLAGYIRGSGCPDSLVVFTAHYDHLGLMGRYTVFPGASDNASGVAMMLALADYYRQHPPRYSVAFVAFSAEELGLVGSFYFAAHPLFNLKSIRFLVNLDLEGNGSEGITVVNGSVYSKYFGKLTALNDSLNLLPLIKKRGEACISDHCPFYQAGVPCFYIYTLGGSKAYHDPDDLPGALKFEAFDALIRLLTVFADKL
jgi:aminopeptidase YwaD